MQLIYINKTFLQYLESKSTPKASQILSTALFFNEQKKTWESHSSKADRMYLELIKNQNEFLEKKWILLKKLDTQLIQEGPYSSQEIFEMIFERSISLNNPIWKEGFKKWIPIKDTSTFKELGSLSESVKVDVSDLLANVMEYQPQMRRVEEESPSPKALGEVFMILDDKSEVIKV